jgi:hypothetical protein
VDQTVAHVHEIEGARRAPSSGGGRFQSVFRHQDPLSLVGARGPTSRRNSGGGQSTGDQSGLWGIVMSIGGSAELARRQLTPNT